MGNSKPCDCIFQNESGWVQRCDCKNSGDLADAQQWCSDRNHHAEVSALKASEESMADKLHDTQQAHAAADDQIENLEAALAQRDEMIRAIRVHGWWVRSSGKFKLSQCGFEEAFQWMRAQAGGPSFAARAVPVCRIPAPVNGVPEWTEACSAALRRLEGGE